MPTDLHKLSGKFIVFDGPDGCGKTTQLRTLITKLQESGLKVRRLREPGGTPIGEQIRDLLLSTKNTNMDVRCEMLLYMASRAQLVHEEILPALAAGECVVSDRFASSTLAYQGGGGGMDLEQILEVATVAIGDPDGKEKQGSKLSPESGGRSAWPDLTIVFDLDTDQAMARINPLWSAKGSGKGDENGGRKRGNESQAALFSDDQVKDRIEQRAQDYFQRVRQNYLWQVTQWPDRYRVVDASKTIKQVENEVFKTLTAFFT